MTLKVVMKVSILAMSLVASSALKEASESPLPDSIKKIIEGFICKEMGNGSVKDKVVATICEKLHSELKSLPEGTCETVGKLLWEQVEVTKCKPAVEKAAELLRWDGSSNCTGEYTVLNRDNMNECSPKYIPAPASIWVQQKNETDYASYHCQGVLDCTGKEKCEFLGDFVVGTCEDLGGFSQKRVWTNKTSESAPLPDSIKKIIEGFICKEMGNGSVKDKVVATICEKLHSELKSLPEGTCESVGKLLWEQVEVTKCKPAVAKAAELLRWDGSSNCTGEYTVLNSDNMDECSPKYFPAPASIWVQQKNETVYSSYHCQGVLDCTGKEKCELVGDFVVGTCEDLGGFSQKRVWTNKTSEFTIIV